MCERCFSWQNHILFKFVPRISKGGFLNILGIKLETSCVYSALNGDFPQIISIVHVDECVTWLISSPDDSLDMSQVEVCRVSLARVIALKCYVNVLSHFGAFWASDIRFLDIFLWFSAVPLVCLSIKLRIITFQSSKNLEAIKHIGFS